MDQNLIIPKVKNSSFFLHANINFEIKKKYSLCFCRFEIHPETGIVTVAKCDTPGVNPCLDYEFLPNKYNFKVAARDELGTSQRTSYATLIIDIDDVNDNPPQVGDYIVDIFENQTITKPPLKIVVSTVQPQSYEFEICNYKMMHSLKKSHVPDGI